MGNSGTKTKGFMPKEKFFQERTAKQEVDGVEACDRTFLSQQINRKAIEKLVESNYSCEA